MELVLDIAVLEVFDKELVATGTDRQLAGVDCKLGLLLDFVFVVEELEFVAFGRQAELLPVVAVDRQVGLVVDKQGQPFVAVDKLELFLDRSAVAVDTWY